MGACNSSKKDKTTIANKNNKITYNDENKNIAKVKQTEHVKVKDNINTNIVNNDINPIVNKPLTNNNLLEDTNVKMIKILFKYEDKLIEENPVILSENELFSNAVYPALNKLQKDSDYSYKNSNFQDIDINKTLKDLFLINNAATHSINEPFIVNVVYNGLDVPYTHNEIINQYSTKTNLIACPIPNSNPFEFRVFCSTDMSLTKTSLIIEDYHELNHFGDFSAYCNGNNYLYLSGGEETKDVADNTMDNKYLSWISKINLQDGKLSKLDNFNVPRFWHSMIFVPNKYVFVVGGNKTKSVEVLNTETGEITLDSELNEYHSEASLCLVNSNYLYCFLGFNYETNDFSNTIERCNIRQSKRHWELVVLSKGNENNRASTIMSRFFTVSYFNEDNLLILGGDNISFDELNNLNENNNRDAERTLTKSYIYNTKTDLVREYNFEEDAFETFSKDIFGEKFFIPMSKSMVNDANTNNVEYMHFNGTLSCLIPKQTTDKLKIYLINDGNKLDIKEFEDENISNYDGINTLV